MKLKNLLKIINRDIFALNGWQLNAGRCVRTFPFNTFYQDRKVMLIDLEKKIIWVKPKRGEF